MTRWSGRTWMHLGHPVRCVGGRLHRHDPQHDDPDLETDVGPCSECDGYGCDRLDDERDEFASIADGRHNGAAFVDHQDTGQREAAPPAVPPAAAGETTLDPRDVFRQFQEKQDAFAKLLDTLSKAVDELNQKLAALGQPASAELVSGVSEAYATAADLEALDARVKAIELGFNAAEELVTSTGVSFTLPASLSTGQVGQEYGFTPAATGGTPPYAWSVSGLPAGLSFDSTSGVVSGTPGSAGAFDLTFSVSDAFGVGMVVATTLSIAEAPAPAGDQGQGDQQPDASQEQPQPADTTEQPPVETEQHQPQG